MVKLFIDNTVTCHLGTHFLSTNCRYGTQFLAEKCYVLNANVFNLKKKTVKIIKLSNTTKV